MRPKTALTKKDLVVVLACILFLLGTLGTIGVSGRRGAKEALCLSNLRQWGAVFLAFAADNNGYFMRGYRLDGNVVNSDYWMEALRPYYGNDHNFRCCPEAVVPGTDETVGGGPYGGWGTFTAWGVFPGENCGQPSPAWPPATACDYGSYGMNAYLCNPPRGLNVWYYPPHWNWRIANVAGAENIPLLTGAQWIDGWPTPYDEPPHYEGQPWFEDHSNSMLRFCLNRHSGYVNSAFLDGSARKVALKQLWSLKWHREFDTDYGPDPGEWPEWMKDLPKH